MSAAPAALRRALGVALASATALATLACASTAPDPPEALPAPIPPAIPSTDLTAVGVGGGALTAPGMLRAADAALAATRFARADSVLLNVWRGCGDTPAGHRALLLLAGTRLDPRNDEADPDGAAWAAARYLSLRGADDWSRPLARQLYLVSLELGADTVPAAALEPVRSDRPRTPPADPGPPQVASLAACDATGTTGGGAGGSLPLPRLASRPVTRQLAALQARVAALEHELDRIRKTLHP